MEPPSTPVTSEPPHVSHSMTDRPESVTKPEKTQDKPTILSEVAYPGPTKEDLATLNTNGDGKHQQKQVMVDDVVKGFRELGKDMTASEMLTMLLRALAKSETEDFFEWLLQERFKDDPPADGKGHWEQLCSVIPALDQSWHGLAETYEVAICYCSDGTGDDPSFGPEVTWSTISPNSVRRATPLSPVQASPSTIRTSVRSPRGPNIFSSPTSNRRKRTTPQPFCEPAISFPKPLGENEAQEANEGMIVQAPKKMKLPPGAVLPTSE